MRPIWMKIKGLNSFLEAQEIDFGQLTSQGLFGIFGPTGSGKSSILDGITMALYGTTARNSSNYINVNTDRASVDYIFSVKEKTEHIYRVSRSFKRSKEGNIRSDGAKFVELTGDEQEVLADRVGTVNEKCREVIGLSKEDFFRTVVLPQGKFSEFLKLEGMERNKMLERLFHLEKYGEQLVSLIKEREARWDGEKKEKEGALSRYGEVGERQILDLKKLEEELEDFLKKKEKELAEVRQNLGEYRNLVQYQQEYEMLSAEAENLEAMREDILLLQEELKKAEKANLLWEYLQAAEQAAVHAADCVRKQAELHLTWQEKQRAAELQKSKRKQAEEQTQKEKPELELQKAKLEDAIGFLTEKRRLEKELQIQQAENRGLLHELEDDSRKIETLIKELEKQKQNKDALVQEIKAVTVLAQTQQAVETGFQLSKEIHKLQKREADVCKRLEELREKQSQMKREQKQLQEREGLYVLQRQNLENEIKQYQEQKKTVENLETEKETVILIKAEKEKAAVICRSIEKQKEVCKEIEIFLESAIKEKETAKRAKAEIEQVYVKNLAFVLAADLKEGEPCPVCGSRHHALAYQEQVREDLTKLLTDKEMAEQGFQHISGEVTRLETRLEGEKENLKKLETEFSLLNAEYLKTDLESLERQYLEKTEKRSFLEKQLEEKEEIYQNLKEELHDIQTQKVRKETEKDNIELRLKEGETEKNTLKAEEKDKISQLLEIQKQCGITDFAASYEEIQLKNRSREEKQKLLSRLEEELEAGMKRKESSEQLIQLKKTKKAELEILLKKTEEDIQELERKIVEKAGGLENPEENRRRIVARIQQIDLEYEQTVVLCEQLEKEESSLRQRYAAQEALAESAKQETEKKQVFLKEKMMEFQVEEESWIENFRKSEDKMQSLREKVDTFNEALLRLKTQLDRVKKQLNGRSVSEEELENLEQRAQDLEAEITGKNKEFGAVKKELEQLQKAWREKEKLQKELEKIYHKLDILTELDGLFRGKRFVEYVSRYYLEYVSREADEQLKEMTGSSYGLETDGNGMFVIRDYKNGGVSRPASTLSGGETFMASLALALALSSQIQMKGAAPLELFFLDEGFGTLDETCLEVVMEALEKIRNKKRSVGVITHVEEIKSRIPVRLLVEPAKMGEGGSKISIEHA